MPELPQSTRMRLRVRVHPVSHHGQLQRVIATASPLRNTHITNLLWHHSGAIFGDRADLLRLGALFRLAAVSPHSAVYLPLRANDPDCESAASWGRNQGLADLVLVRRDVPLPPSAWPGIRDRLRRATGTPATMHTPAPRPQSSEERSWKKSTLSAAEHAATVFLSGPARVLLEAGDEITWCGEQVAGDPDIHRFGGPVAMSQFKGADGDPGRRDGTWECMVLAHGQIFHRARWERSRSNG